MGVDFVGFLGYHFCSVVVGPSDKYGGWKGGGWGQAASTVETFLEVSGAGVER